MLSRISQWAHSLKRDTVTLYLAARDPRTPWYAKGVAACVVAYALSPIDLIPDFIPVIGYLDDILLIPIGLWIAIRLMPSGVIEDCRSRAAQLTERPTSRTAAFVVIIIWIGTGTIVGWIVHDAITV